MKYKYICVEGNIAAGKTTLASRLAQKLNVPFIPEAYEENTFLPKFYREPEKYAFQVEMSFLLDRYAQLNRHFSRNSKDNPVIADYTIYKSLIFAENSLKPDEFRLFSGFFEILAKDIPDPGLLVYLNTGVTTLKKNIIRRGRDYEQKIPGTYLLALEEKYHTCLQTSRNLRILMIHTPNDTFFPPEQDDSLIEYFKKDLPPGITGIDIEMERA